MASKSHMGVIAASLLVAAGGLLGTTGAHAADCIQAFAGQTYQGPSGVCLSSGALSLYLDGAGSNDLSFEVQQVEDGHIKLVAGPTGGWSFTVGSTSGTRPIYLGALARAYVEPGSGVAATGTMSLTGTFTKKGYAFIGGVDASMGNSPTEVTLPFELSRDVRVEDTLPTGMPYVFDAGLVPMVYVMPDYGAYLSLKMNPMVIDVSVAAVPEPATWGMMALGLVGLGFARRRVIRAV